MALFRHVASGTAPGEEWSWTLHTEGTASTGDANATFAAALNAFYTGGFAALTTADVVTTQASTATINPATDGQETRVESVLSLAGSGEGEMLPFQCATVCTLVTALANRHGRGRFYLPPLGALVLDAGRINTASLTGLQAALTDLFDALNTGGLQPVVRNRTGHISTPVVSARVGNVIDTQRRRRNQLIEVYASIPVP